MPQNSRLTIIRIGAVLIFLLSKSASAETSEGLWTGMFSSTELSDSVSLHQEVQIRKNTETGLTQQSLFRTGPLWQWNTNHEFGLLYVFSRSGDATEHRLIQQHSYQLSEDFSLRTRIEERTYEKQDGLTVRLRLQARYEKSISKNLSVILSNELFYQIIRPSAIYDHVFDRDRTFIGLRSKIGKVSLDYGYLNQYSNRSGADLIDHLFIIYLNL